MASDYDSWSLSEIKQAMRDAGHRMREMSTLRDTYTHAADQLDILAQGVRSAQGSLDGSWSGPAADSATRSMTNVFDYSHHSRASSAHMSRIVDALAQSTAYHHDQVEGIDDVDTSPRASMTASGMNPFAAMADHNARVAQASQNQKVAAGHAEALQQESTAHNANMAQVEWPAHHQNTSTLPPRSLPHRHTTTPGPPPGPGPVPQPGPIPVPPPTPPVKGTIHHPRPTGPVTDPIGTTTTAGLTGIPGVGSGGVGGFATTGAGTGGLGAGVGVGADLGAGLAGGLAGALGLGGAGLSDAGLGDAGAADSESADSELGGSGLDESGPGESGPGESGPGESGLGESGLGSDGSGSSGTAAGESAAREAAAAGEAGGTGSGERAAEAGARGEPGMAEEPVAGERGAMMGAPGGGRRGQGEQEHATPDYLEEDFDVWAMSDNGVPPVLGEEY